MSLTLLFVFCFYPDICFYYFVCLVSSCLPYPLFIRMSVRLWVFYFVCLLVPGGSLFYSKYLLLIQPSPPTLYKLCLLYTIVLRAGRLFSPDHLFHGFSQEIPIIQQNPQNSLPKRGNLFCSVVCFLLGNLRKPSWETRETANAPELFRNIDSRQKNLNVFFGFGVSSDKYFRKPCLSQQGKCIDFATVLMPKRKSRNNCFSFIGFGIFVKAK